ncbi:MAG: hypothetical protein IMZ57_11140 [Acidobacteria bacterium]|nr:hypothetical protein [Acidobacteriota bacterium]
MRKIFSDLSKLDFSSPSGREKIFAAVQYFASGGPAKAEAERYRKALQAFGASGDFPAAALQVLEKFHATPAYDMGYEEIFDIRDFNGTTESGFEILDVEDGLTFREVPNGEKAHIFKMAGSKTTVNFGLYGGGLGWLRTLIDDKKFWTLEDSAIAFVNKAAAHKAECFYALVDALGVGHNVAWQLPDPAALANTAETYTANRDAQTLNLAAQTILLAIADKGYGVTPANAQLVVLTPLQMVGRLNRALSLMLQSVSGSATFASYKFRLVPTTMLLSAADYYVGIPKLKAKGGTRMNLTIFNQFDATAYADIAVGWSRFGGALADQDQFARCKSV